jgi:hypothetical protein
MLQIFNLQYYLIIATVCYASSFFVISPKLFFIFNAVVRDEVNCFMVEYNQSVEPLPLLTFNIFLMQGGSSRRIGRKNNDETFITIASKYGFDGERQRERMERRAQKLRDRRALKMLEFMGRNIPQILKYILNTHHKGQTEKS